LGPIDGWVGSIVEFAVAVAFCVVARDVVFGKGKEGAGIAVVRVAMVTWTGIKMLDRGTIVVLWWR